MTQWETSKWGIIASAHSSDQTIANMYYLIVAILVWLWACYLLCRSSKQDELSEKSLLASKKDELDAAAKQWMARVEKSDAEKFSVAGKMGEKILEAVPTINILPIDNKKRTPQAKRFKLKEGECLRFFISFFFM